MGNSGIASYIKTAQAKEAEKNAPTEEESTPKMGELSKNIMKSLTGDDARESSVIDLYTSMLEEGFTVDQIRTQLNLIDFVEIKGNKVIGKKGSNDTLFTLGE